MTWQARLDLAYRLDAARARTVAHDAHAGPLRVLKALYPEGDAICHHVLVHPPGGIAGGDRIEIELDVQPGAHALVTTPGATRFYRSGGETAMQSARLRLRGDARLEWLPMASIAYDGCLADNRVRFELDERSQMIGWDLLALGLPASQAPFARGRFVEHLEWPGRWLERGAIDAGDHRLLRSPLGLGGRTVMATLWCAAGTAWPPALRESLLDAARRDALAWEGCTSPQPGLVLWRALGDAVEPLWQRAVEVRARWRLACWGLPAAPPRVWST
jgi:urease accessory protein